MVRIIRRPKVSPAVVAVSGEAIVDRSGASHATSGIVVSPGVVLSPGVVVWLALVFVFSISLIPSCVMLRGPLKWRRRRPIITLWRIGVVSGVGLATVVVVVVAVLAAAVGASFDGSRQVGLGILRSRGSS